MSNIHTFWTPLWSPDAGEENKSRHVSTEQRCSCERRAAAWCWCQQISCGGFFYCTFAPRRSRPPPRHYAPTTGPDPSPLQDSSLLIRSLLVSGAPGSRTFKPRSRWTRCTLFELKKNTKMSWRAWALWQTNSRRSNPQALRSSTAPQDTLSFHRALKKKRSGAVRCFGRRLGEEKEQQKNPLTLSSKPETTVTDVFPH